MSLFIKYLAAVFIIFSITTSAHAELYKWVDEHGKVHYSDKAPNKDKQLKSKTIPLQHNKNVSPSPQVTGKPIIRPYERTSRPLHLLDTVYFWKKESESGKSIKLGAYHIGKACTSRGAIKTPEVFVHHSNLLPKEKALSQHAVKVINGLDYEANRTQRYELIKKLKRSGGLSLHSEIVELNLRTCAPNIRRSKTSLPLENISSYQFTKNRVYMKVKWQLKSDRDQTLVYETVTEGSYSGWNKNTPANQSVQLAMESAVLALFSDRQFIDQIMVKEEPVELVSATEQYSTIQAENDKQYKKLFLDLDIDAWRKHSDPATPVGRVLFGEKCTASKPLQLMDITTRKKVTLPSPTQTSQAVINRVKPLGYRMMPNIPNLPVGNDNETALKLKAQLMDINFDLCAPSLPASSKHKSMDSISKRKLTNKRVQVSVKWMLRSLDNRHILYQSKTTAHAGDLLTDAGNSGLLQQAIGKAAEKLFAEPRFIEHLVIKNETKTISADAFNADKINNIHPIIKPGDRQMHPLFVVSDPKPWSELNIDSSVGVYAIGSSCTPVMKRNWPQAYNKYPSLFPKKSAISQAQAGVIKSLGYPYRLSDQTHVLNMKRKLGGLSLHAKIRALRYDSCAADIDKPAMLDKKLYQKKFNRHRVIVDIDWQLYDQNHQQVIYQTLTQGAADSWLINNEGQKVVLQAVENATKQLFSDATLVEHLSIHSPLEEQEKGLFEKMFSALGWGAVDNDQGQSSSVSEKIGNNYVVKARLSEAMAELTAVKVPVMEYYMSHGEWPDSLEDINLPQTTFEGSKSLSYVSIDGDGSIVGELHDSFGSGKILRFTPGQNTGMINRWTCSSNLPARVLPNPCENSPY